MFIEIKLNNSESMWANINHIVYFESFKIKLLGVDGIIKTQESKSDIENKINKL